MTSQLDFYTASLHDFFDIDGADLCQRASLFGECIDYLHEKNEHPFRRVLATGSGPIIEIRDSQTGDVRELVSMASNDYLNLTRHPKTVAEGIAALEKYGCGSPAASLLGGCMELHLELERKIAEFKGCQAAMLFSSGFGSNFGAIMAMLNKKDIAIVDMFSHASLIEGCHNTNCKLYRHNDMKSLERILEKTKDAYRTKLIVTDGVFSMDGDIAKLDSIVELARHYGALVMCDEAHATGVLGRDGRGTAEHYGLEGEVDIVAGTFSKCLGSVGGFIASNDRIVELLRYYARTYIFSTAPPPSTIGSILAALDVIENEPALRASLWDNIEYFKKGLLSLGFDIGQSETAIFPVIVGDNIKVRQAVKMLEQGGVFANAVQYPAVPRKQARIRFSLMCNHSKEHLDKALEVLEYADSKLDLKAGAHRCAQK